MKIGSIFIPQEILGRILFYASLGRGVKRALRLKLVCRKYILSCFSIVQRIVSHILTRHKTGEFHNALKPALFKTRILDDNVPDNDLHHLCNWRFENLNGADKFWHEYFLYRTRNETDESNPKFWRYTELRQVAKTYCSQTGAMYNETLDALCWLTLGCSMGKYPDDLEEDSEPEEDAEEDSAQFAARASLELQGNLLCAAICLGSLPLAKKLLQDDGIDPAKSTKLFPAPSFLAGYSGRLEMTALFHNPNNQECDRTTVPRELVEGLLQLGQQGLLRAACGPRSDFPPESRSCLNRYHRITKSLDPYLYIRGKSLSELSQNHLCQLLVHFAEIGNAEAIRQLSEHESFRSGPKKSLGTEALILAAKKHRIDIVDILLEDWSACPNGGILIPEPLALFMAVKSGSLPIVRKLLNHKLCFLDNDYRVPEFPISSSFKTSTLQRLYFEVYHRALEYAVRLEHTAILELLLEFKKPFDVEELKTLAAKEGLESMLGFLERYDEMHPHGA